MMNRIATVLLALTCSALAVTGVVVDQRSTPVSDATIQLAVNGSSTATTSDGSFTLISQATTDALTSAVPFHIDVSSGLLNFSLPQATEGALRTYDIFGHLVFSLPNQTLTAGDHQYAPLGNSKPAPGVYIVQYQLGSQKGGITIAVKASQNQSEEKSFASMKALRLQAAAITDTVLFSKTGLISRSIPISDYSVDLGIVMMDSIVTTASSSSVSSSSSEASSSSFESSSSVIVASSSSAVSSSSVSSSSSEASSSSFESSSSVITCIALDQCHNAGTADHSTGICSNPAKIDGAACNDGNQATINDVCISGTCSGTPITCTPLDQCHNAGTADHSTGICSNPAKTNGTTCDDGDAATSGDACTNGVCSGTPITCSALDQCHNAGTADHSTGMCSNPAKTDGAACNDGNQATDNDVCTSGTCSGTPIVCPPLDQCHTAGTLNASTGMCSNPAKPDGTACNDGNPATDNDVCTSGTCSGTPITCSALDQCHNAGTADHSTGMCSNPAKPDGTACNDGNPATTNDTCVSGVCSGY